MSLQRSLVIPAFNEAPRLAAGFERLAPVLAQWAPDETEIVFVDDGSSDNTLKEIARVYGHLPNLKVVQHEHNLGKGAAVRTGWASAKAPHVLTIDADMAIDPSCLAAIDAALLEADVAAGDRSHNGSIRYDSWSRTVAGDLFHRVVTHYTKTTVRDTQCGCKGFRLEVARLLGLLGIIEGFAYDAEVLALAQRLNFRVTTVPVTWHDISGSSVRLSQARSLLRDLHDIPRTRFENPVVIVPRETTVTDVRAAAIAVRQRGLVVARRENDAMVVLPRDAGLNAIAMASTLSGTMAIAGLDDFRGAELAAV
jgi:dolichyl-phosphate beta-glucosyltransferase